MVVPPLPQEVTSRLCDVVQAVQAVSNPDATVPPFNTVYILCFVPAGQKPFDQAEATRKVLVLIQDAAELVKLIGATVKVATVPATSGLKPEL